MLLGTDLALAMLAVFVGALVQGAIGIGLGMVIVPVFVLMAPESLPAVPLLLALPLTTSIAVRERAAVDLVGVPHLLLGRILGTVAATWLLTVATSETLQVLFALVILIVVALSTQTSQVSVTPSIRMVAGTTSGLFSTTAAIGGPPLALLYQGRPGPEMRSTIGVVSLVGAVLSLVGLVLAGRLHHLHVGVAMLLAPAMTVGFIASRRLTTVLDRSWLRPTVLAFAAVSAIMALLRAASGIGQ